MKFFNFLLDEEFLKNVGTILVIMTILVMLEVFSQMNRMNSSENLELLFEKEPVLVVEAEEVILRPTMLIHSDDPEEWGKILADDGNGNVAIGFNRLEDDTAEVLP